MLRQLVDVGVQPWDGLHRWWVQYTDGGQIDLVVLPAASRPGRAPGSIALLDRYGRLAKIFTPRSWTAAPDEPRRWLLDGWEALSNGAKYVQRGSLLEGIEQIHRGRTRVLQLWAVGQGVAYPAFGLTSLLDATAAPPPGIQATYPSPDRTGVLNAALATATRLYQVGHHARPDLDTPLHNFVTTRLQLLDA
jgi:hypothetical protein